MTTAHHDPHPFGGALSSAAINARLSQLDAAIEAVVANGSGVSTTLAVQANAGSAGPFTVASTAGIVPGDLVFFGDAGGTHESKTVLAVPTGTTFTTTANLASTYAIGKAVSKSPIELIDARGVYTTAGGRLAAIEGRVTDVKRYGAIGNDTADDTAAIQAAITAAGAGGTVLFPTGVYKITAALTVAVANLTLLATGGAEIHQATASTKGIAVTADGCHVEGLTLRGPQFAADQGPTVAAIYATGASAAAPIVGFVVRDCQIHSWGFYGVAMQHVTDFRIIDNRIFDLWYNGVMGSSAIRGVVAGNIVRNMVADSGLNQQPSGIAFGRIESDSITTDPRSRDITIEANVVQDCPWQGIDTHGGQNIIISGNTIRNCRRGVSVTDTDNSINVSTWAALDVAVIGNQIDSTVTNGSALEGINFSGSIVTTGTPIERATGSIVGNVVRGHGPDGAGGTGAGIRIHTTQGVVIAGNTVIEPSSLGISIDHDNDGYVVSGNAVVDPWSDLGASIVAGVVTRSSHNRGFIGGNSVSRGGKTAGAVITFGVRLGSDVANSLTHLGVNFCEDATTPLSDGGGDGRIALRATKLGFYTTAPIAKVAVTGSRGGNAALASLLTALANMGLITDSTTA